MFEAQTPPERMPGKEGEQRNPATWRSSEGPPATPFVLILLGFQMQGVTAEPKETSKYQDIEKDRCLNHLAEAGSRWMVVQTCSIRQEGEKRNSQERDARNQIRNSKGEDPGTF